MQMRKKNSSSEIKYDLKVVACLLACLLYRSNYKYVCEKESSYKYPIYIQTLNSLLFFKWVIDKVWHL